MHSHAYFRRDAENGNLPRATRETTLPVTKPGRYVAVASVRGRSEFQKVSDEAYITGDEPDEVPVTAPTSLEAKCEAPDYAPGDTAAIIVRTPVTGIAWVSVETDRLLDTLLIPLHGNTNRIEIPVKKEYAPNAHLGIYLLRPGANDALPSERFTNVELKVRRPDLLLDVAPHPDAPGARPGENVSGFIQVACGGTPVAGADVTVYAVDDAVLELGHWAPPDLMKDFYPDREHLIKTLSGLSDYTAGTGPASQFEKGFTIGGGGEDFSTKLIRKDFRPLAVWLTGLKTDRNGKVPFTFVAPDNLTRYRIVAVAQTRLSQFGLGSATVDISKPLLAEPVLPRFLRSGDEVELRVAVRESALDQDSVTVRCTADRGVELLGPELQTQPVHKDLPAVFRFRAKVGDASAVKIGFQAASDSGDAKLLDAVEVSVPIHPPTLSRREAVAGTLAAAPGGGSPDFRSKMPEDWKRGSGTFDLLVSSSPYLTKLTGLPAILEYPHGCFEQISSRVLVFLAMKDLLGYLPTDATQEAGYRATVERALQLYDRSLLDDGSLPYWPGEKQANAFVTIQAAWAVHLAASADYDVPEDLADKLDKAVDKILAERSGAHPAFLRAFALLVRSREEGAEPPGGVAAKLYADREHLGDDGRALLALSLASLDTLPDERAQLVREIDYLEPPKPHAFDPAAFSSPVRGEAMRLLALNDASPAGYLTPAKRAAARERLLTLLDEAPTLSTQENLWSLLAFLSYQKGEHLLKLKTSGTRPAPSLLSLNGTAAAWTSNDLARASGFHIDNFPAPPHGAPALTYVMRAVYRVNDTDDDPGRRDHGLRLERVVHNLTDPARTGDAGAPVRLNDRLLVTYRMNTTRRCDYVALEDELPAGLEALNPDLSMFSGFYQLPVSAAGERVLELSSSELKDEKTCLFFDRVDPGASQYSVLVRASAAGAFQWPSSQVTPMYEPLVSGFRPLRASWWWLRNRTRSQDDLTHSEAIYAGFSGLAPSRLRARLP